MEWNAVVHMLFSPIEASYQGFVLYAVLLPIGFIIGGLTGFFGIGGGFLIVPLLHTLTGIPYQTAVGSSLTLILGTSFSGILRQHSAGNIQIPIARLLIAGSVVGAVLGDIFQDMLYAAFGYHNQSFPVVMHVLFLLLLITILLVFCKRERTPAGEDSFQNEVPYFRDFEGTIKRRQQNIPLILGIGLLLGVLTGLLGIGGGVLLVPILIGFFGLPHKKASATSLVIVFCASLSAIIAKGITDQSKINLILTLILVTTSIIGMNVGVFLLEKTGIQRFRRLFFYIILLTIGLIAFDITKMSTGG